MIVNLTIDTEKDLVNVQNLIDRLSSTNRSAVTDDNVKPIKLRKIKKYLSTNERNEIRLLREEGVSGAELAKLYNVSTSTIYRL